MFGWLGLVRGQEGRGLPGGLCVNAICWGVNYVTTWTESGLIHHVRLGANETLLYILLSTFGGRTLATYLVFPDLYKIVIVIVMSEEN